MTLVVGCLVDQYLSYLEVMKTYGEFLKGYRNNQYLNDQFKYCSDRPIVNT